MTNEEKQLLLVDLCARLPYEVIVDNPDPAGGAWDTVIDIDICAKTVTVLYNGRAFSVDDVMPYLRPMSSMTEEEEKELKKIHHQFYKGNFNDAGVFSADDCGCTVFEMSSILNYLMSHNFDYRGLIEKGLALEAKEGMYKTE